MPYYPALPRRWRTNPFYYTDVATGTATSQLAPFAWVAIASGTQAAGSGVANHPGVMRLTSSTTTNSGGRIGLATTYQVSQPGDYYECVFSIVTLTEGTFRIGFGDSTTVADHTDGVYFEIVATGVATAKTSNNTAQTSAVTTATLSTATWYRAEIEVVSATDARFRIFNSDTGAVVLAEQTIATNIPTARVMAPCLVATNVGTVAVDLIDIDMIGYENRAGLTR